MGGSWWLWIGEYWKGIPLTRLNSIHCKRCQHVQRDRPHWSHKGCIMHLQCRLFMIINFTMVACHSWTMSVLLCCSPASHHHRPKSWVAVWSLMRIEDKGDRLTTIKIYSATNFLSKYASCRALFLDALSVATQGCDVQQCRPIWLVSHWHRRVTIQIEANTSCNICVERVSIATLKFIRHSQQLSAITILSLNPPNLQHIERVNENTLSHRSFGICRNVMSNTAKKVCNMQCQWHSIPHASWLWHDNECITTTILQSS